jgi:hypothetical protein
VVTNRLPQTAPVNTAVTKPIDPAIAIIESVDRQQRRKRNLQFPQ